MESGTDHRKFFIKNDLRTLSQDLDIFAYLSRLLPDGELKTKFCINSPEKKICRLIARTINTDSRQNSDDDANNGNPTDSNYHYSNISELKEGIHENPVRPTSLRLGQAGPSSF